MRKKNNKKNKKLKGFTIIELVASFVIIAMLLGVGIIAYSSIYKNATESYYHTLESSLMLSGSDYFYDHRELLPANSYSIVSIKDLMDENYTDDVKDQNGNLCLNGEVFVYKGENNSYQYEVCLRCGGYQSEGKYCREYNVDDKRVKIPTNALCNAKNKATYTGNSMSLTIVGASKGFTFENNYQKDAGKYEIKANLKDDYVWSDNTIEPKVFNCELYKRTPTITLLPLDFKTVIGKTVNYNETADTNGRFVNTILDNSIAVINYYEQENVTTNVVNVTGKKEGQTTILVEFYPSDTKNYNSLTIDNGVIKYNVDVKTGIEIPTKENVCDELVYNGNNQVMTCRGIKDEYSCNNVMGKDAGEYEIIASLAPGLRWEDATSAPKKIKCTIKKAETETSLSEIANVYSAVPIDLSEGKSFIKGTAVEIKGTYQYKYYSDSNCSISIENPKNVGTYYVKARLVATANYNSSESECTKYQIKKRAITVKADDQVINDYGSVNNDCNVVSGSIPGRENLSCVCSAPSLGVIESAKVIDSVTIKNIYKEDITSNYDITKQDGIIKIACLGNFYWTGYSCQYCYNGWVDYNHTTCYQYPSYDDDDYYYADDDYDDEEEDCYTEIVYGGDIPVGSESEYTFAYTETYYSPSFTATCDGHKYLGSMPDSNDLYATPEEALAANNYTSDDAQDVCDSFGDISNFERDYGQVTKKYWSHTVCN